MKYSLPKLPYKFDALEPYIDAKTMEIHYTKHHQAYVDKLNLILDKYPELANQDLKHLLSRLTDLKINDLDKNALKNSAGGHLNHAFFWEIIDPKKTPNQDLMKKISAKYESVTKFKETFSSLSINLFGSGWTWLVEKPNQELDLYTTPNQDSPYLKGDNPIIALDLWEHAYYLKYQNRRIEYIQNFWKVIKII
jgi:superoxide dismutase, Fe-Mn family